MLLGWILFAVGVTGFGMAAYLDLKTTEFPDWLPYSIIASALAIRAVFSFLMNDFSIITESVLVGMGFLLFGLALYALKQWGDGDAWLLGSLGFLFPDSAGFHVSTFFPFYITLLFNFFFIAFLYLIIYSIALGLKSPKISKKFFKDLKKDAGRIASIVVIFTVAVVILLYHVSTVYNPPLSFFTNALLFPVLLVALLVFVHYGRFIENNLFRKKIDVKDLKIGDVPVKEKWRVLTEKEVNALKKKGGTIWIKEGVRFAPVFIITIIISLLLGNILSIIFEI